MTIPNKPSIATPDLALKTTWGGTKVPYTNDEINSGHGEGTLLGRQIKSTLLNHDKQYSIEWLKYNTDAIDYIAQNTELYVDNGTADAINLTIGSGEPITAYYNGLKVRFFKNIANTGAATINVEGIGVKSLVNIDGSALTLGSLLDGNYYYCVYDNVNNRFILLNTSLVINASEYVRADGTNDFIATQSYNSTNITNATNATPIVITSAGHGRITNNRVFITGVNGNTSANGVFFITKIDVNTFSLNSSAGNGVYTSGGEVILLPTLGEHLASKSYVDFNVYKTFDTANMPTIANNTTDANNDIDFISGTCFDSGRFTLISSTNMTKRLDATFTAGNNGGGLDTGAKAINTWYHCFVISRNIGGVSSASDYLFSLSPTSPTLPTGFNYKRRIGSVKTDSSGNILAFIQDGDTFYWKDEKTEVTIAANASVADTLLTINVPSVRSKAMLRFATTTNTYGNLFVWCKSLNKPTIASMSTIYSPSGSVYTSFGNDYKELLAIDSQVNYAWANVSSGTSSVYIINMGYIDARGKN